MLVQCAKCFEKVKCLLSFAMINSLSSYIIIFVYRDKTKSLEPSKSFATTSETSAVLQHDYLNFLLIYRPRDEQVNGEFRFRGQSMKWWVFQESLDKKCPLASSSSLYEFVRIIVEHNSIESHTLSRPFPGQDRLQVFYRK
jgi:hypothetical protein